MPHDPKRSSEEPPAGPSPRRLAAGPAYSSTRPEAGHRPQPKSSPKPPPRKAPSPHVPSPHVSSRRRSGAPPPPSGPRPFRDPETGFEGFEVCLPGARELPTPCVAGGQLYLGGGFGSYELYALDGATGHCLWSRRTSDDGPTAATHAEGRIVFNTESCTLCVYDAGTGESVWERWLGDPLLAQPAVGEGRVFMAYPSLESGSHTLAAFALGDGAPLWETPLAADVITAPVVAEGSVWASTWDGTVSCFDVATGKLVWQRDLRATSAPWVWKGDAYVSRREADDASGPRESTSRARRHGVRRMQGLSRAEYLRSKRGSHAEAHWKAQDDSVGFGYEPASARLDHVEKLTGWTRVSSAWRYQGSRPCVWNGILYGLAGDALTATRVDSGTVSESGTLSESGTEKDAELWRFQAEGTSSPAGERALTPPAVTGGRVYAGGADGCVRSWDAETGRLRWAVDVGGPVAWQPAVSGGRVLVGLGGGRVVSFATGDPADDGWPMWGGGPGHNG